MTTQRESKLSRWIMHALRDRGVWCMKIHGSEFTLAGAPDIIACVDGIFLGLEVKNPGQRHRVSARQHYVHTQVRHSGGIVEVVTSVDEAVAIVTTMRETASDQP